MERTPDRLAALALLIVDEAAEQAERGDPVKPTVALRFALAFLCSRSDGPIFDRPGPRHVFDELWTVMTEEGSGTSHMKSYARSTQTRTCLQQIGRQLQFGPGIFHEVRAWRSPAARARREVARALAAGDEERAHKAWRKRGGYFGRPYPGDERKPGNDR